MTNSDTSKSKNKSKSTDKKNSDRKAADKKNTDKKNIDKKASESKNNWVGYAILIAVVMLITGTFFVDRTYELSYPNLIEVIEKTQYQSRGTSDLVNDSTGKVVVVPESKPDHRQVFSQIRDVQIDTQYIRGKAKYSMLDPDGKPTAGNDGSDIVFRTTNDANPTANDKLRQLLTTANIDWKNADPPSPMLEYLPFMLPFILLGFIVFYTMRKVGGIGSPMQFGRSKGRLYADEDNSITFDDVAGIDEAVEEVREIVDFLQHPEKYQKLGGRIPKGVLLVGPPGTGKTLLARAIAGEAGVPFYSMSGSDFVEMFVGVGAARVRDMFQQAAAKAPCIIFIDELDALGKSRAGNMPGAHDEREQTLNALLVEMDGFDANTNVIVMAATNRPETLDSALLRPGRFDRNVLVDRPDKQGREEILKVHVKNVKLGENVELRHIASITPGFVGADLANLVNEAALLAARKGKNSVGQEEFNDAVERLAAGLEKKKRVMNESEKRRVAYHEAGHALVAYSLPDSDPVHKVSIIPRGIAALGYTMQRPEGDRYLMTQPELEAQLQVLLAGTITEEIVFRDISTGASNDLERATNIARGMVTQYGMSRLGRINYKESNHSPFLTTASEPSGRDHSEQTMREIDQEVKRIIDEAVARTRSILTERRAALEALSQRLIDVEVVDADDLRNIIDATLPGPRVVPGTSSNNPGAQIIQPTPTGDVRAIKS